MKVIEVSENILNLNEILNFASMENIMLKISDGREFILAEIDSFDRELELTRQNEELMEFLDRRSDEGETYTLEEVKQLRGSITDISERKQAEYKLLESEHRHRVIFEHSPLGMIYFDTDGTIVNCNDQFVQLMGSSREKLIGFNTARQSTPEMRKAIKKALAGNSSTYEDMYTSITGNRTTYLRVVFNPVHPGQNPTEVIATLEDISDRKYYEEQLKSERDLNERMMATSPAGIVRVNAVGQIVYANKLAEEILDIRLINDSGRTYDDPKWKITSLSGGPFPKEDLPFSIVRRTGEPVFGVEHAIEWPNGRRIFLSINAAPLFDQSGLFESMVATIEDITDSKKAEEKLKNALEEAVVSQKETTALLEAAQAIPLSADFHESARKIFDICSVLIGSKSGYVALLSDDGTENKVLFLEAGGLPCDVDPELPMPIRGLREVAYRTQDVTYDNQFENSEWTVYMPPGHVKLDNVLFSPLNIKGVTVGVIGLANKPGGFTERDIQVSRAFGDLAGVALKFAQYQDELRYNEERFRSMFEMHGAVMLLIEPNTGQIIDANLAASEFYGYSKNTLKEMTVQDINCLPHEEVSQRRLEALNNQLNFFRFSHRLADGEIRSVEVYSSPIPYSAKKALFSIVHDITDRTKAEKEARSLQDQLQQAQRMESIGNLAGGIAHDFNNILSPVIGMSEMLLEDLAPDSPEYQSVKEIFNAGRRGADLVKQILSFSRRSEHKMMPTSLQNVLKEVISLSRSTIPTYIEINQDIQQDCGMVLADPSQIHQIGMNIITNAYHAVESTGGQISITLKQTALEAPESLQTNLTPGHYAVISFSDTGHGMSKELIGKIFDPYFTTKEQGKGTGLGLAVVYGIVKAHGGEIKVYTEVEKGSTFDIYLPLMKKYNGIESISQSKGCQGGNERILLVDDEESIAKLEKQMLERLGYSVTSRISGVDALEAFKASPSSFDLVVTDMSMPNIPGDELARKIKTIRPDVPVIICTGFSERIHEDNIQQMGIDGLLMKPILRSELATVVRKVLDEENGENQG